MPDPDAPQPQPQPRRPTAAPQLLLELVNNALDPGYAAAAARHGPHAPRRWYDRPAVAAGAALIGFLLVVAYIHTNRGAPEAQRVHDGLVDRVRSAQQRADALAGQLEQDQRTLAAAQDRALPATGALAQDLDRAQLAAGQVAVHGPGLVVMLAEPPQPSSSAGAGRGGTTPIDATHILTDRDVRSVVNELWADGAEAIAVNGIRLTPTSAIRFAGEAVLVDFQPITSPYDIEAVGNADTLSTGFAESAAASRYQTLSGADGLGFSFADKSDLKLPASGPYTPRYATAQPAPGRRGGR